MYLRSHRISSCRNSYFTIPWMNRLELELMSKNPESSVANSCVRFQSLGALFCFSISESPFSDCLKPRCLSSSAAHSSNSFKRDVQRAFIAVRLAVPQQKDAEGATGLQLASPFAVQSWAARELCDGRKSQGEEGTKAGYSNPQHESYIPLRPPKHKVLCTASLKLYYCCVEIWLEVGVWVLIWMEGIRAVSPVPWEWTQVQGLVKSYFTSSFVELGCSPVKCESWEPG